MPLFFRKTGNVLPEANEVVRLRLEADPERRTLETRVVQADRRRGGLVVRAPMWQHDTVQAAPGRRVAVAWWERNGEHVLVARIARVFDDRTIPLWALKAEGPAQVVQRRQFVRVPAIGHITLDVAGRLVEGAMIDLSENGMRVSVKRQHRLEVGQSFTTKVPLGEFGELPVRGQVRRTTDRASPPRVELGVEFVNLPDHDRDLIRKHLFALMREQRRRERGA
jgi:c-di-GMP-binding flagellar brake protein YcgR